MNGKKRGIRLKPVNQDQEGYRALFDFFAVAPPGQSRPALLGGVSVLADADQPIPRDTAGDIGWLPVSSPDIARRTIARRLREELEETLRLLDKALMTSKNDGTAS